MSMELAGASTVVTGSCSFRRLPSFPITAASHSIWEAHLCFTWSDLRNRTPRTWNPALTIYDVSCRAAYFQQAHSSHIGRSAPLPLWTAILDDIWRQNPLKIVHGTDYNAVQSQVALDKLGWTDRSALASAALDGGPCVFHNMDNSVALTLPLPRVQYCTTPSIGFTMAFRHTGDCFRSTVSLAGSAEAPENSASI